MSAIRRTKRRTSTSTTANDLICKWGAMQHSEDLVSSMVQHQGELQQILTAGEISEQCFQRLVSSLVSASRAKDKKKEYEGVLKCLCESPFLTQHVGIYISSDHGSVDMEDLQKVIANVVDVLNTILNQLPQFSFKVMVAAAQLNLVVKKIDTLPDRDGLMNSLSAILREKSSRQGSLEKHRHRHDSLSQLKDADTPPDNLLDISVIPTISELQDMNPPFLRRAVVRGPYKDVEHYLDVQFRLMKQDFLIPLKNGLNQLRGKKDLTRFRCSDLRLYHNVKMVQTSFTNGYNHVVKFDIKRCRHIDWKDTTHLMNGSIVCLSKDGFTTIIVATVSRRNVEGLEAGRVEINVKDGLEALLKCTVSDVFVMAESTTFYDPYFHVLEGLKTMPGKFPFQNILIECKCKLKPASYILTHRKKERVPLYNLSCLMREREITIVPVLTTVKWPQASVMCLNESQRDAAIMALTKEVCVIQGPPGTGKTYVGLKVVETLLENKRGFTCSPILIVCYTNHALDQFLEGVTKFCPTDIVRIGGGCKTESLQQFNLNKLVKKCDITASNAIQEEINQLLCKLSALKVGIKSADVMRQFMTKGHYESLKKKHSQLSSWLNAPSGEPADVLPKQIHRVLKNMCLQWNYSMSRKVKLGKELNILERCAIYFDKVKKVKEKIQIEMHFAKRYQKLILEMELKHLLALTDSGILSDEVFDKYLDKSFSSAIHQIFHQEKHSVKNIIKYWLLGKHRGSKGQLEDIEILSQHFKEVGGFVVTDKARAKKCKDIWQDYEHQLDMCYDPLIFANSSVERLLYLIRKADELKLDELEETLIGPITKESWQNASYSFAKVIRMLSVTKPMSDDEEGSIVGLWKLDTERRYALYLLWLSRYEAQLKDKLVKTIEHLKTKLRQEKIAEDEIIASILKVRQIKIIGTTTTGAAKHKSLLEKVGCSVVVVEEAAEVLESHVITALNENCQHLILIGDHQQLRPKPATYELERNFGLDVSLFERLIKNNIPHVTLKIQHRMRPEVSQIIKLIYPGLEDHPSVCEFEHIRGVSKDVFFINHNHEETSCPDSFSKTNLHEAEFAVALCLYLLKQDYKPTQITILATYKGQVTAIKHCLGELEKCVRVSSVDDFQGEENEIIILSLVRNNDEDKAGFVKIDNRVCVALSRAKKGFYVLGNFDFMASKSKLWRNIIETAKKNKIIGRGLPVHCHNHPESVQRLSTADEFDTRPEGGCGIPCIFILKCGHRCQLRCHGYNVNHENYVCEQACLKTCIDGHRCLLKCYEVCQCQVLVAKTLPECGHQIKIPCCVSKESAVCQEQCFKTLPCGHPCAGKCSECLDKRRHMACYFTVDYIFQPCNHAGQKLCCLTEEEATCHNKCSVRLPCGHTCSGKCSECLGNNKHNDCLVEVDYTQPSCGHLSKVPCYKTSTHIVCTKPCTSTLKCGHQCKGTCSDCLQGLVHQACNEHCHLPLPCGHPCQGYCSTPCLPCELPCPFRCRHRSCRAKCGQPCTQCRSTCMQKCAHLVNLKYCSENWDAPPCREMCTNKLNSYSTDKNGQWRKLCVHPCNSVCGEICACADCEKINVITNEATKSKLVVPILKLPLCKHIFYISELDQYVMERNQSESNYIYCPLCEKPLLNCMRYDDINQQRFQLREQRKLELILRNNVTSEMEDKLERSRQVLRALEGCKHFEQVSNSNVKFLNRGEFFSESIKLKFMYAVSLLNVDLGDGQQSDLIHILNKIARFSQQKEMEMIQEITRRLSLFAFNFLEKQRASGVIETSVHDMNELRAGLNESPARPEVLERAHEVILLLSKTVKKSQNKRRPSDLKDFADTYIDIMHILKSNTEETLVDVLYPELGKSCKKRDSGPQPTREDFLRDQNEAVKINTQLELLAPSKKVKKRLIRENVTKKTSNDASTDKLSYDRNFVRENPICDKREDSDMENPLPVQKPKLKVQKQTMLDDDEEWPALGSTDKLSYDRNFVRENLICDKGEDSDMENPLPVQKPKLKVQMKTMLDDDEEWHALGSTDKLSYDRNFVRENPICDKREDSDMENPLPVQKPSLKVQTKTMLDDDEEWPALGSTDKLSYNRNFVWENPICDKREDSDMENPLPVQKPSLKVQTKTMLDDDEEWHVLGSTDKLSYDRNFVRENPICDKREDSDMENPLPDQKPSLKVQTKTMLDDDEEWPALGSTDKLSYNRNFVWENPICDKREDSDMENPLPVQKPSLKVQTKTMLDDDEEWPVLGSTDKLSYDRNFVRENPICDKREDSDMENPLPDQKPSLKVQTKTMLDDDEEWPALGSTDKLSYNRNFVWENPICDKREDSDMENPLPVQKPSLKVQTKTMLDDDEEWHVLGSTDKLSYDRNFVRENLICDKGEDSDMENPLPVQKPKLKVQMKTMLDDDEQWHALGSTDKLSYNRNFVWENPICDKREDSDMENPLPVQKPSLKVQTKTMLDDDEEWHVLGSTDKLSYDRNFVRENPICDKREDSDMENPLPDQKPSLKVQTKTMLDDDEEWPALGSTDKLSYNRNFVWENPICDKREDSDMENPLPVQKPSLKVQTKTMLDDDEEWPVLGSTDKLSYDRNFVRENPICDKREDSDIENPLPDQKPSLKVQTKTMLDDDEEWPALGSTDKLSYNRNFVWENPICDKREDSDMENPLPVQKPSLKVQTKTMLDDDEEWHVLGSTDKLSYDRNFVRENPICDKREDSDMENPLPVQKPKLKVQMKTMLDDDEEWHALGSTDKLSYDRNFVRENPICDKREDSDMENPLPVQKPKLKVQMKTMLDDDEEWHALGSTDKLSYDRNFVRKNPICDKRKDSDMENPLPVQKPKLKVQMKTMLDDDEEWPALGSR